jgi:ubiquinone/menaquinone biosynthesis C-methylase UbiE
MLAVGVAQMNVFSMRGRWGWTSAWLYERVVGAGIADLYDRFVEEALPELPAGSTIIDVGCGQGQVASRLASRLPDCQVVGFDLSEEMIELARALSPSLANLEFHVGDALRLPLPEASVDLAVSVASIKHWPSRVDGVRELLRALRPGGRLALLEADRDCDEAASRRFVSRWRLPSARLLPLAALYFQRFVAGQAINLDELVGVLTRAGAVDIEAWSDPEVPVVIAQARKAP